MNPNRGSCIHQMCTNMWLVPHHYIIGNFQLYIVLEIDYYALKK